MQRLNHKPSATFCLLALSFLQPALAISSTSAARPTERTETNDKLHLTAIDDVIKSRQIKDSSRDVLVRGTLVYYKPGDSAVLASGSKSLYAQISEVAPGVTPHFEIGDVVDAVGIPTESNNAPGLRHATLSKVDSKQPVAPRSVSYSEASSGHFAFSLVSMNGTLVSQRRQGDLGIYVIDANDQFVTAYLEHASSAQFLEIGSHIEVVGVCIMAPPGVGPYPRLSHLQMRSEADVTLITKPSGLTIQHFLWMLTILSATALGIAIWAALLKRRVINQTVWIDRSMIIARERSRILEMITFNQNLDELLTEICKSTMELLPGTRCLYQWHLDQSQIDDPGNSASVLDNKVFELPLVDSEAKPLGRVTITSTVETVLPSDHNEVYRVLTELVDLAIRQSLLYRGLVHHSTHDPLTGLPNRRLCESRLEIALQEAELNGGRLALVYIDINHFKPVNDKFGHKVGDTYLQQISARFQKQIRSVDTLARVGGDEFVVIAPFPEGFDRAYALTGRLRACFDEPFTIDGQTIHGSASLGFARYPEHGKCSEELTRHADHAMYVAKNARTRISEDAHGIAIITPDELQLALLHNRFRLAYQPQFSPAGDLTGLEALIRLDDPVLGIITPDAFISVAERHPVIIDIGAWALRCVLQDAIRWKLHLGAPMTVAVNVSIKQLEKEDFAETVLASLTEYGFPPSRLEIELIERSLMITGDAVAAQLRQLRSAGVRIAIDDFGTGQSCLSLLHRLPIDTIKLDRSFIQVMEDEPAVAPILQAIVSMAQSLGKRVVAEAVERESTIASLLRMGNMDFQGYLFSRPVAAEDVHTVIHRWRSGITMSGGTPRPRTERPASLLN